jgi:hypothetical protein
LSLARNDKSWAEITLDSWALGMEAWLVVGLRTASLMRGGPAACTEARLMCSEKVGSGVELGTALLSGKMGDTPKAMLSGTVTHYLDGVRANRKRLVRSLASDFRPRR